MSDSSKFKIHVLDTTLPLSHESEYMCMCAGLEKGWWSSDPPLPRLKNLNFLNLHIKIPSKMPQTSPPPLEQFFWIPACIEQYMYKTNYHIISSFEHNPVVYEEF